MKSYNLNNGVSIPVLGFGTWKAENGEIAYQAVLEALKMRKVLVVLFEIAVFQDKKSL